MYAKIFSQILDSSIAEDPEVRFTFMDLLILADIDGVVDVTHEAIARRTNRPLEVVRATIAKLESPDPASRTAEHEGRRIKRIDDHRDWGWIIVNYHRFRMIASDEQRRERTRIRTEKYRERKSGDAVVTQSDACDAMQRQRQRQKKEVPPKSPKGDVVVEILLPESHSTEDMKTTWKEWIDYRKKKGKCKDFPTMFKKQLSFLSTFPVETAIEMMNTSMRNGWTGLFEVKQINRSVQSEFRVSTVPNGTKTLNPQIPSSYHGLPRSRWAEIPVFADANFFATETEYHAWLVSQST